MHIHSRQQRCLERAYLPMTSAAKAEVPADQLCGVGSFRPRCLQAFAKAKCFTLLYGVLLIFQNAQFYYFFGIMSTLQRRYGLSSWFIAVILFAVSVSPFFVSFAVGHYSRRVSKPVLLFWSIVCLVVSCCTSAVPYLLYGPGVGLLASDAVFPALDVCPAGRDSGCDSSSLEQHVTAAALFVANCFYGAAYSVLYVAGSTYVDDSVKKKNSPLHFAFMAILKLLGPTLGYSLASVCLRYYEDPRYDPGIEPTDPRWVGAWWLGYVLLAIMLSTLALPILLFPKHLSSSTSAKVEDSEGVPPNNRRKSDGFFVSLKRLFRNRLYTMRLIYWLLVSNVTLGHGMMSAKYMEVQYQTSASKASFLSGPVLLLTNALGLGAGGMALHIFRPKPRLVASYTTFCDIMKLCCYMACMFIGCQGIKLIGTTSVGSKLALDAPCNSHCNCTTALFQPVCVPEVNGVFFSPCYAGCHVNFTDGAPGLGDCSCLSNSSTATTTAPMEPQSYLGFCDESCENIVIFVALMLLVGFITRTTTVAHTILGLRVVDKEEKSMALGVQEGLSSIFSNLRTVPHFVRRRIRCVLCLVAGQVRQSWHVLDLRRGQAALLLPRRLGRHLVPGRRL
ncbi:solute carrier organic anion transporter family member 4C1-like isoform X2 [Ornithodoros turicata]|uniref:solute carrier organic anion transporter family member 4C1-like isoform X2 n=1 Tax=Ornithodoros turicata TaxID=34597 RepID=UPI00313A03C4